VTTPPTPRGTETLLVVEDDATILTLISQALARLGYRVLSAPDGRSALETYGPIDGPIHLPVTDVVMPHMSGAELAQRLNLLRPGLKVLYASGYTEDAIVHHGVIKAGVNFLQKPYTPTVLAHRIRLLLDASE